MDSDKEVIRIIFENQKKRNMSREVLAERLGCTTRLIRYWENGERGISINMADRALSLFGVSYILGTRYDKNIRKQEEK